jgi:hypothetical protein
MSRVRELVGVALLVGVSAGCSGHASISLPPTSAPSDVVLDTYLQALVAGDCVAARAMEIGQLAGECNTSIRKYSFDHNRSFSPSFAPDSVQYVVSLTVSGVGGGLDGDHNWFYWLAHQPNGAWLVTSAGTGP